MTQHSLILTGVTVHEAESGYETQCVEVQNIKFTTIKTVKSITLLFPGTPGPEFGAQLLTCFLWPL